MAGTNGDTGAAPKVTTTVGKKNVHGNTKEEKWSVRTREILRSGDVAPYKEVRRPMLSRVYAPVQQLVLGKDGDQDLVLPGLRREGCCVCCVAPDNCPCLSLAPCYGEPIHIHEMRESSKYILIRENSVEWNSPVRVSRPGGLCSPLRGECCGVSCFQYDIKDDVKVVYFDDATLDRMRHEPPACCGLGEKMCGGDGERLRMDSDCCCGLCLRGTSPLCFIPCCLPCMGCAPPCLIAHDMLVQERDLLSMKSKQKGPHQHQQQKGEGSSSSSGGGGRGGGRRIWRGADEAMDIIKTHQQAALRRLPPLPLGECAAESMVKQMEANIMERQLSDDEEKSPEQLEVEENIRFATDAMAGKFGKRFYGYMPRPRPPHCESLAQQQQQQQQQHGSGAHGRVSGCDLQHARTAMMRMYRAVVQVYGFHAQHEDVRMGVVKELQTSGSSIPAAPTHQPLCACCHSPANCPCCAFLPCCMRPKYIVEKLEASKFILIRENSIEWNNPRIVSAKGNCLGLSLCYYDIQDDVSVMYYDDPMFESIGNRTRWCNESRTVCCGGQGERIRIASTVCGGLCVRGVFPCPCVPNVPCLESPCCACLECCALQANIYVKPADGHWGGAEMAVDVIQKARIGGIQRLLTSDTKAKSLIGRMGSRAQRNCDAKAGGGMATAGGVSCSDIELLKAADRRV
jgi:hypothetical protein